MSGLKFLSARLGIANTSKKFLPFYESDAAPQCSTFNRNALRVRPKGYTAEREVAVCGLNELLDQWRLPYDFEVLVLDMEGNDIEAIETLGLYLPKIIVTEVWSFEPEKYMEKFQLLANRGYVFLTRVGHDDVFMHQDYFFPLPEDFLIPPLK